MVVGALSGSSIVTSQMLMAQTKSVAAAMECPSETTTGGIAPGTSALGCLPRRATCPLSNEYVSPMPPSFVLVGSSRQSFLF